MNTSSPAPKLTVTDIVVLSDGDSDSDVAILGSRPKASRVSTSPVFVRASRSAEVFTLVDTDTDSDSEDLDTILAAASVKRGEVSSTGVRRSTSVSTEIPERRFQSRSTTTTSRMSRAVSTSRSILSVLEGDWDNQPAAAERTESTQPRKKRRKADPTNSEDKEAANVKAREREVAKAERERQKQQDKLERQRVREEARVR